MTDQKYEWECQVPGEKEHHFRAFQDWMKLGGRGMMPTLHKRYVEQKEAFERGDESVPAPPTTRHNTLQVWSKKYHWYERHAARLEHEAAQRIEAEREKWKERTEIVETGDWEDYLAERDHFLEVMSELSRFKRSTEQTHRRPILNKKGEETGNYEMVTVVTVQLAVSDYLSLSRWRKTLSDRGRRIVGLPDRFTAADMNVNSNVNVVFEFPKPEGLPAGDDEDLSLALQTELLGDGYIDGEFDDMIEEEQEGEDQGDEWFGAV